MTTTRAQVVEAARRRQRVRRTANWIILGLFVALSLVLAGTHRWVPLLIVVAATAGLLWWVLWASMRAGDQRRQPVALVVAALVVCLVPAAVIPLTYNAILEPQALMRTLLLLMWGTIGVTVWTFLDRWRRRAQPMANAAWVGIVIAVASIAVSVLAPLPGLAGVGKPQIVVVDVTQSCEGKARTVDDGLLVELTTFPASDRLSARTKDSQATFHDVPYYARTEFSIYVPQALLGPYEPELRDPRTELMSNGDIKIRVLDVHTVALRGYVEVIGSLLTGGILEPRVQHQLSIDLRCYS